MSGPSMDETAVGIFARNSSAYFMADTEMLEISKWRCVGCVTTFQINWLMYFRKIDS